MGLVAPRHVGSSQTRARTLGSLHWQADSQPLRHQGSPVFTFFKWLEEKNISWDVKIIKNSNFSVINTASLVQSHAHVLLGLHNKTPQMGWGGTSITDIFLKVLEDGSPRSRCWQIQCL